MPRGPGSQLIDLVRKGRSFSGRERNCVFLNIGDEQFVDISGISGIDFPDDARSVGRVDWDYDGDVDLWLANRNAPQVRFLRNDVLPSNRSLSVRLQGTTSNRDAIGARVTLLGPSRKHMQTVKAGDGYLTQSSKWVHFGDAREVKQILVRWPNGTDERFDLEANLGQASHVVAVEGTGKLMVWSKPAKQVMADSTEPVNVRPSDVARTVSVVGMPITQLPFQPLGNSLPETMNDVLDLEGPLLVSLWASWCAPCMKELSEWSQQIDQFRTAGVNILAVSVDGLDAAKSTAVDGEMAARQLSLKFPVAIATPQLVERLQLMHDYLFSLQQPLPIPSSFLLDSKHRLLAIYKGPVSLQQVRHDLGLLDATYEDKRDAGTPFQGRWAGEPRTLPLGPFVVELMETGAIDEASEYVQRNQSRFRKVTILDLVVRLGIAHLQAGNEQIAERHFQMARKIEPKTVGPEIEQGKLLESRGEHRAAKAMYQAALIRNQSSPQALNNLAWLLATSPDEQVRNGNQALQFAMKASRMTGDRNPGILDTFAAALAEEQRWDEAIQVSTRAESLARQRWLFQLANEIASRIVLYKQRTPIRDAT